MSLISRHSVAADGGFLGGSGGEFAGALLGVLLGSLVVTWFFFWRVGFRRNVVELGDAEALVETLAGQLGISSELLEAGGIDARVEIGGILVDELGDGGLGIDLGGELLDGL